MTHAFLGLCLYTTHIQYNTIQFIRNPGPVRTFLSGKKGVRVGREKGAETFFEEEKEARTFFKEKSGQKVSLIAKSQPQLF